MLRQFCQGLLSPVSLGFLVSATMGVSANTHAALGGVLICAGAYIAFYYNGRNA